MFFVCFLITIVMVRLDYTRNWVDPQCWLTHSYLSSLSGDVLEGRGGLPTQFIHRDVQHVGKVVD